MCYTIRMRANLDTFRDMVPAVVTLVTQDDRALVQWS